jgi:hypothetical protein
VSVALVPGETIEVGRSESLSLGITKDPAISRRHFSIETTEGGEFELKDVGSVNGTLVNGRRVTCCSLRAGDRIDAGESIFVLKGLSKGHADAPDGVGESGLASTGQMPGPEGGFVADLADPPVNQVQNDTPFPVATIIGEDGTGRPRLTLVVKATFRLQSDLSPQPASMQLPILRSDEHYEGDPLKSIRFESDTAPFKPRCDVVLVGAAYAPQRRPVTALGVRLRIGSLERSMAVFGDREWRMPGGASSPTMTDPKPFTRMELTYERAFGGIDTGSSTYWPYNLVGTGFIGRCSHESVHQKRLPNLEDPSNFIRDWNTRPKPMGFGFFGRGWLPRLKYAGTYDDNFRKGAFRGMPPDWSERLFNGAHPDLQIDGYLVGDEPIELINLSPTGDLSLRLPGLRPRLTVRRYASGQLRTGLAHEEHPEVNLDTLCLVPDDQVFYMVFRAVCALTQEGPLGIKAIEIRL